MHAVKYLVAEAAESLWQRRRASVAPVATIATGLFVLAGFLLVTSNMGRLLDQWSRVAELSVYLRDDISPDEQAMVERLLSGSGLSAGQEYLSKTDALQRFTTDFPDLAAAVSGASQNPLPASFEVRLLPGATSGDALEGLAKELSGVAGVADVRYDRRAIDRLSRIIGALRLIGIGLVGALAAASALSVASVVRLALLARSEEIWILRLVGAPMAYIRMPFVVEGILHGLIGGAVALVGAAVAFAAARARYGPPLAALVDPAGVQFLSWSTCAWLLAGGIAVGCFGGFVASRDTR